MSLQTGSKVWIEGPEKRAITLAALLKSGGAGSVYQIRELPSQVVKIYHPHQDLSRYERKVQAMLSLSPNLKAIDETGGNYIQIAWPQALIRDAKQRFIGFLMPSLDIKATSELEYILQERQARAEGLPTGLGAKITLAANLSAVISELHKQQHYIVDLKPVNLRFYRRSLYMAMLDCDGFSIQGRGERFEAPQYTPDYLAPEFQANGIDAKGDEQQDRFALAVIIFQLLNFGIHPFTGKPSSDRVPTDIPGRIRSRAYAYGIKPNKMITPSLVSGHQGIAASLRHLFDRAFEGVGNTRPSAAEWAAALTPFAQKSSGSLLVCKRDDQHQHFASMPCAACARDQLLKQARKQSNTYRPAIIVTDKRGRRRQKAQQQTTTKQKTRRVRIPQSTHSPPALTPNSVLRLLAPKQFYGVPIVIIAVLIGLFFLVDAWKVSEHHSEGEPPTIRYEPETSNAITAINTNVLSPKDNLYREYATAEEKAFFDRYPALPARDLSSDLITIREAEYAAVAGDEVTMNETLTSLNQKAYQESIVGNTQRFFDSTTMFMSAVSRFDRGQKGSYEEQKVQVYTLLEQILIREPRSWLATEYLAENDLKQQLPTQARNRFIHAVSVKPDNVLSWYGLAISNLALKNENAALGAMVIAESLFLKGEYSENSRVRVQLLSYEIGFNQQKQFEKLQIQAKQLANEMYLREISAKAEMAKPP